MSGDSTYQLSLLVTEKCNLNCTYCHCDRRFHQTMTFEQARAAIDDVVANKLDGAGELNVLFIGGEPFIEFSLIKEVVAYASGLRADLSVRFKAVTNGTLVHGEVQKWLMEHQDRFRVDLSMDGVPEAHDRFRSDSYDKIDHYFFQRKLNQPTLSTVVLPETTPQFAENIMHLERLGYTVKAVLADGVDWSEGNAAEELARQFRLLIEYYLTYPEQYPFNLLSSATFCVGSDIRMQKCRPGVNSSATGTDGVSYPCHRCTAYYNHGGWAIATEYLDLTGMEFLDEACLSCCAEPICNACPASIASMKADPMQRETKCKLSKMMFMANAYFHLRLLAEQPGHIFLRSRSDEQKIAMLRGAKKILSELNPATAF